MNSAKKLLYNLFVVVSAAALVLAGCGKSGSTIDKAVPSFCPTGSDQNLSTPLAVGNSPPKAYYQSRSVNEGSTLQITLLACDPDQPSTSAGLTWQVTVSPVGQLSAQSGTYPSAVITYDPDSVPAGSNDSFWYYVMDSDGAVSNQAEIRIAVTNPGTGIDPAKVSGTWFGPARLAPASSADNIPIFSALVSQTFGTAKVNIDSAGVVTSIDIDGTNFSSIGSSWQADLGTLDGDKLAHLDFPNAPLVNIGAAAPVWVPVLDGGGLLFDQSTTSVAGTSPQYAFLFIHDKFGIDLAIATLQRGASGPLPSYSNSDLDITATGLSTTWSGFSAEFVDQTISPPGAPLDLRFQGYPSWSLQFDDSLSVDIFVTGGSIMDSGTTVAITSGLVFASGSGYFTGTMTDEFSTTWNLDFLMSPDGQFIAGFGDDPGQSLPWRWHDIALTKQ